MRAPCLTPGGTIGICSPSHVAQYDDYQSVIAAIRRKGYRVREADNLYRATDVYLASPRERADDLNQLIADPEVELVLFGGGEGSDELLPYIDFENVRKHPKRVCSYSDGTTILDAIWAQTGLETYYGQMPHIFLDLRCYDYDHFLHHLVLGDVSEHFANSPWRVQAKGTASGTLIGGYLCNFALLLGSRYFPIDLSQKYLLFLEDHEHFGDVAHVSALLSYIEQTDFIRCVTGLLFGHYSEKPYPELLGRIRRFGEEHGIPAVYCDDFGHGISHAIFPIGRPAMLDTEESVLRYL